jgi:hypothetical protein
LTLLLKRKLFDSYGGFSDKRIKNLEKGEHFIIDDRSDRDFGADRALYSYFCSMIAVVLENDKVKVVLSGNVPVSQEVYEWGVKYRADIGMRRLSFIIDLGNESILDELADRINAIVAPGRQYDTPNYKYVCPRTANSLRRLTKVLTEYWGIQGCDISQLIIL